MSADVGAHEGWETVCPISPPHFWGIASHAGRGLGLEISAFLFTPVLSVCLSVSKCPLYVGTAVLLEEGSILISLLLDFHQLCEDLSFVCTEVLGIETQHLDLRERDVTPRLYKGSEVGTHWNVPRMEEWPS